VVQLGPPRHRGSAKREERPPRLAADRGGRSPRLDTERPRLVRGAALEAERFLALRASFDLRGRPFDPTGPRPRFYTDSVWCFLLEEVPGERTRLVVSGYASARPRLLQAIVSFLFWEPAHWIMQTRQFSNLKRRAERSPIGDVSCVAPPKETAGVV
jgi:hypothetical protein